MKVHERTVADLLRPKKTFVIPAFQRRYAWKVTNFSQLWEDILQVLDGARARHFMGTVVFEPDDATLSVIDGQQRLITFTVILRVLHDLSMEFAPGRTREIGTLLGLQKRELIRPSLHDRPALAFLMENPTLLKKSEHRSIHSCYDFFFSVISAYITGVKGQKPAHFGRILEVIRIRMIFVEIALADQDDTHAIFETINYAGVPLTAADLARNFVLGRTRNGEEQHRLNQQYWQPLEMMLSDGLAGTTSSRRAELTRILPEFLRSVLIVERQKYIAASDLFRELKAYFREKVEAKLEKVLEYATHYQKFLRPLLEPRRVLQDRLSHLLDLRMTTYNPVLLVLFRAHAEGSFDARSLAAAIQSIESFIVRRSFNSKVSRDLPKVFARVAIDLSKESRGNKLPKKLLELLAKEKWPTDDEFRPCFLSTPIYSTARETARFVLLSLERSKPMANERRLDKSVQIEHIFPQGAKSADWDQRDMPELKRRLHVIGNLTITANNPKYSNHGYEQKRGGSHGYLKSPYWLTKTLAGVGRWNGLNIDRRGERLFREALKLWPGPDRQMLT